MLKARPNPWWQFTDLEIPPDGFPKPDCFETDEWAAYYHAARQAVWNPKSLPESIKKDMCEDCTLAYQHSQVLIGKCNPHYGVSTPVHRAALMMAGEPDPNARKYRGSAWSDDES